MPTYCISTWDCEANRGTGGWHVEAEGVPRKDLRAWFRELYGRGYSPASVHVEREG